MAARSPTAHQNSPVSQLGSAPLLVREYMRLFANACRLVMLLRGLPRKDVVQVGAGRWLAAGDWQITIGNPSICGLCAARAVSTLTTQPISQPTNRSNQPNRPNRQVYTIACHELIGRDPPGRRALCSFLAACDAPVALLQHRFVCVSQRVCQVRCAAAGG
jgi:hypothetical protein